MRNSSWQQAYFTDRALENISHTTIANLNAFERGDTLANEVTRRDAALRGIPASPRLNGYR
jgi:hypothetical protein